MRAIQLVTRYPSNIFVNERSEWLGSREGICAYSVRFSRKGSGAQMEARRDLTGVRQPLWRAALDGDFCAVMRDLESCRIVRGRPEDAAAIARVHIDAWRSAYHGILTDAFLNGFSQSSRHEMWCDILSHLRSRTHVAVCDARIAGFVSIGYSGVDEVPLVGRVGMLFALYVHPDMWWRRIGTELLRASLSDPLHEFRELFLWVFAGNVRARRFYGFRGFRPTGVHRMDEVEAGNCHRQELYSGGGRPDSRDELTRRGSAALQTPRSSSYGQRSTTSFTLERCAHAELQWDAAKRARWMPPGCDPRGSRGAMYLLRHVLALVTILR
jgi:GNAT superfamily N-acetyltransferase